MKTREIPKQNTNEDSVKPIIFTECVQQSPTHTHKKTIPRTEQENLSELLNRNLLQRFHIVTTTHYDDYLFWESVM